MVDVSNRPVMRLGLVDHSAGSRDCRAGSGADDGTHRASDERTANGSDRRPFGLLTRCTS
jgi:hypothetical protein